ncbi:hypothetical protein AB0945_37015 [Streptomyces sp. NPDC005474]|uniref:hypothetical protein n=1 Tax=Streptomyces sp. NPDC005474 TaxID=3154878 RepID=UPI003452C1A0
MGLTGSEFLTTLTEGKGADNDSLGALLARMERDEFDLTAVGRLLRSDPEWAAKICDGRLTTCARSPTRLC